PSSIPDIVVLDRRQFQRHHLALRRRILRLAIAEIAGETKDFYFGHFESMLKIVDGESPNAALPLPNGWEVRRAYDRICFQRPMQPDVEFAYEIAVPGRTELPLLSGEIIAAIKDVGNESKLPAGKFQAAFDLDRIQFPLQLRNRRAGDRFQPFGMAGTKKVKDLLIDAKVPQHERVRVPILVSGDQILWVVGHRTSERFKVGSETKRLLYLTYLPQPTENRYHKS
ncbi:MAG: tRNA lysidine(34) synthetase TilS, partial [Candidatus Poribacteria bacterium]|nr:tRNA lysidine(34) synthetase TilS [Candidatus Poribacteria bacterium]